ncbi:MAG: hypothetical protein PHS54_07465 [Clostridia bacterium]|nr:hypothetical protein [Clostridia bacterium]
MGFWKLNSGEMVEIVFDNEGNFIKFNGDFTEEEMEDIKKEIISTLQKDRII